MGWADKAIAELKEGKTVTVKPSGNSMTPLIVSKQEVVVAPLFHHKIYPGDVVLCVVKGNQYLHKVIQVAEGKVLIGNNHGRTNGWTPLSNVYGVADV